MYTNVIKCIHICNMYIWYILLQYIYCTCLFCYWLPMLLWMPFSLVNSFYQSDATCIHMHHTAFWDSEAFCNSVCEPNKKIRTTKPPRPSYASSSSHPPIRIPDLEEVERAMAPEGGHLSTSGATGAGGEDDRRWHVGSFGELLCSPFCHSKQCVFLT